MRFPSMNGMALPAELTLTGFPKSGRVSSCRKWIFHDFWDIMAVFNSTSGSKLIILIDNCAPVDGWPMTSYWTGWIELFTAFHHFQYFSVLRCFQQCITVCRIWMSCDVHVVVDVPCPTCPNRQPDWKFWFHFFMRVYMHREINLPNIYGFLPWFFLHAELEFESYF